jgi:hypothetical protein
VNFTANASWNTIDLLQNYKASVGASAVGATIMRTHLWVLPAALVGGDVYWVSLMVGDLNDITAGTATTNALVPNPHDDPYLDWMYVRQNHIDVNAFNGQRPPFQGVDLDLKSKRRMHQVQMAYTLNIYQETVATPAKAYTFFARTLLALP